MKIIKNIYNLIKLLTLIDLSVSRKKILIQYLDNHILIQSGKIKLYTPKLVLDYEEMFQHCDEWFVNSSSDQRDAYLNSVIRDEIELDEEVIICL